MTIVTQQNLFVFWWEHKNKPVSGWTTRWISSPLKNSQQKQYEHKKPTLTRLSFPYILLKQTALSLSVRDELLKSSLQTRFVSTEAEKERNRRPLLLKWWILSISGTLKKLLRRRGVVVFPKQHEPHYLAYILASHVDELILIFHLKCSFSTYWNHTIGR